MNRDTFGQALRLTLFGESHGPAIGCVVEGLRPGTPLDMDFMAAQLARRRGPRALSTARREADGVELLSGAYQGRCTGTALCLCIRNGDTRSGDYAKSACLLRPGHGDYTGRVKYMGYNDPRGGGHFSGRLTAPIVAAGSIFLSLLREKGVFIGTRLRALGGVEDTEAFSQEAGAFQGQLQALGEGEIPVLNPGAAAQMEAAIAAVRAEGDSLGGILETQVLGLPPGLGEPFFGTVESQLGALLFALPAVKGVEFGAGFQMAALKGSQANDPFRMEGGRVVTSTNHNGGINGGITNGMPLVLRTAVKPTPSIYKPQDTVDICRRENAALCIEGRHDPCIAHRAAVVQDSLIALGLCDLLNQALGLSWQGGALWPEEAPWNMD